ncbi:hypothetical protein Plhal703r1_c03g0015531 [Plasmopara halstedii]
MLEAIRPILGPGSVFLITLGLFRSVGPPHNQLSHVRVGRAVTRQGCNCSSTLITYL